MGLNFTGRVSQIPFQYYFYNSKFSKSRKLKYLCVSVILFALHKIIAHKLDN